MTADVIPFRRPAPATPPAASGPRVVIFDRSDFAPLTPLQRALREAMRVRGIEPRRRP